MRPIYSIATMNAAPYVAPGAAPIVYSCAQCNAAVAVIGGAVLPRTCGHHSVGVKASVSATATGEGGM